MNQVKVPDQNHRPPPLVALCDRALRTIDGELQRRLEERGFGRQNPTFSRAFGAIPPEGIRLTDLAERMLITKQAAGEIVDQMEASGYVERRPDPSDGRAKLIGFTDAGWAQVAAALDIFDEIESRLAERFGAERMATVREVLTAMTHDGTVPPGG